MKNNLQISEIDRKIDFSVKDTLAHQSYDFETNLRIILIFKRFC